MKILMVCFLASACLFSNFAFSAEADVIPGKPLEVKSLLGVSERDGALSLLKVLLDNPAMAQEVFKDGYQISEASIVKQGPTVTHFFISVQPKNRLGGNRLQITQHKTDLGVRSYTVQIVGLR